MPPSPTTHRPTPVTQPVNGGLAIGLVYLDRWPALPQELNEREILTNRICTLLSNKPRSSHLIHLLLRAPKEDVQAALRTLLMTGCIHIGRASTVPTQRAVQAPEQGSARTAARREQAPEPPRSLIGRWLHKLSLH